MRVFCDYCAYNYLAQADEDLSDLTTQQCDQLVVRRTYTETRIADADAKVKQQCCAMLRLYCLTIGPQLRDGC